MSREPTIPRIVRGHVDASPDRAMFTFRDLKRSGKHETVLRYGDLWSGASVFAEAVQGISPKSRALLVMPIGPRLLQAHLGMQMAGVIPIIHSHPSAKVDHDVYLRHLSHVLDLMMPEVVITTGEFTNAVRLARQDGSCQILTEEELPAGSTFEAKAWKDVDADDIAIIQHSSGSTGLQKGIALTHAMVRRQCECYAEAISADPNHDCICSWIPLYHDMGLFTTWFLPLLQKIPVAAIDPFDWIVSPASFLHLIRDHGGTLCWQPNFAFNLLATKVSDADMQDVSLDSMRAFISCAEPVRARSFNLFLERFRPFGLRESALSACYAMAENAFAVTTANGPMRVLECDPAALSQNRVEIGAKGSSMPTVSCGRAIKHCEVKIVDEQRNVLPEGRVGEVALRSSYMLREYFRNPEATARAIDAESWYYSGDLGFQLDSELYITGRKKDLLIVGGRNFYPQDIEAVCDKTTDSVPGRAVAIGIADDTTGTERIVVLVESHKAADVRSCRKLEQAIRASVIEELDCQVSEVHVVPHMWLLKTTSGKIARAPNLDRFRQEFGRKTAQPVERPTSPQSEPVSILATAVWSFLLALALYILFAFSSNLSFGIYAKF